MHSTPLELSCCKKYLAIFLKIEGLCSFAKCNFTSCRHLEILTSCLHAILIMRGTVLCNVTERQTGAVKMATAEEIKLLVTSKSLAMVLMVVTGI